MTSGNCASYKGEGNGNPLQCSCLENPRDGGAWWAAVYGVAQSRTRLKRLKQQQQQQHKVYTFLVVQQNYPNVISAFDLQLAFNG